MIRPLPPFWKWIAPLFLLTLLHSSLPAQDTLLSFFEFIYPDQDHPLEMTLSTDVKKLIRDKYEEEYQPAELTFIGPDSSMYTYQVKIRPRGNRRKEVCFYPPVKLKFKKKDLERAGLERSYNKYKLVVQCKGAELAGQYIWREYLAYRLFNHLSPYSFRVRALKLYLIDKQGRKDEEAIAAFLIEDDDLMEERLSGTLVERKTTLPTTLERMPHRLMSAFQYMIGNTDYYVYNSHNLELIKLPEFDRLIAIPYDFDYAGLVNTTYSVPHERIPIKDVRQRWYTGEDCTEEEAEEIRKHFYAQKESLLQFCSELEMLDDKSKKQVGKYLEKFFKRIDKPGDGYKVFRQKQ